MAPKLFICGHQLLMWPDTMGIAPPTPGIPMHEGWSARLADDQRLDACWTIRLRGRGAAGVTGCRGSNWSWFRP